MRPVALRLGLVAFVLALFVGDVGAEAPVPEIVEFNRDIRSIFADKCFACHGPDKKKRKADLRLDTEKGAFIDLGGYESIVPGKPEKSEIYRKITSKIASDRMPPRKSGKTLSAREIELVRRWIAQGAKWQKHWSFIAPRRPALPSVADASWPVNAVDRFILARLEHEDLKPSPAADRRTLLRRLSFDLTGLPPTPEQVDVFRADKSERAYENAVDRLLASPHFGERMALYWLDLVRYGDTGGYHSDNHRDVYLYRDYVIKAFNDNMPFDRFTIEQLAGDLLPNATRDQKIASGYNRLLLTTEEGGAQAKEYLAKYAADRVRNASSVWLGATLACCECHDHKFDPYATKEFYRFASFFADLQEVGVGRQQQTPMPSTEQAAQLQKLDAELAPLQKILATQTPELDKDQAAWEKTLGATPKGPPKNILDILKIDAAKRNPSQKQALAAYYRTFAPQLQPVRRRLVPVQTLKDALLKTIPTTLISISVPPRVMHVLPRGNWLLDTGEIVTPGTPASLPALAVKDRRATRLDLARWLVAPEHPMVARVFVNRLWKLAFGLGIVHSLEDFGSQGAWPTHPELLDWLAVEFRESGWNIKRAMKLLVMSRTYRQTAIGSEQLRQRDPYNHLLARQSAFRLDGELVRDNALAVSGLLTTRIGGPSVNPYQPAGYWDWLNFPRRTYQKDTGPNQYRRGLYTYIQRTFPHPSLGAFDAPSREECTVERPRSNTPQQALVLLNDPTYVEAARTLAERLVRGAGAPEARIQLAYRQALARSPSAAEVQVLETLARKHLTHYRSDPKAALALHLMGDRPMPKDIDPAELAAWTSVARVVLNLHETITRN